MTRKMKGILIGNPNVMFFFDRSYSSDSKHFMHTINAFSVSGTVKKICSDMTLCNMSNKITLLVQGSSSNPIYSSVPTYLLNNMHDIFLTNVFFLVCLSRFVGNWNTLGKNCLEN